MHDTQPLTIINFNCSATTEKAAKISSTMKSIIIGRPSTTTTAQPDADDEDVGFLIYWENFICFVNGKN